MRPTTVRLPRLAEDTSNLVGALPQGRQLPIPDARQTLVDEAAHALRQRDECRPTQRRWHELHSRLITLLEAVAAIDAGSGYFPADASERRVGLLSEAIRASEESADG